MTKFNLRAIGYNTELLKSVSEMDVITTFEDNTDGLDNTQSTV